MWSCVQREIYEQARAHAGRSRCPSVVVMDGQSVKTTERAGGVRGFDGHKRVKGRKRHILVDTLGLPIANRVEPASISDRRAGARLLAGVGPLFLRIQTVIADAGHESRKLARELLRDNGWKLQIVKRRERVQDHRSDVDRGTHVCVARAQPTAEQRLRIRGADFGDDDRRCHDSVDAESTYSGMNFSNTLSLPRHFLDIGVRHPVPHDQP